MTEADSGASGVLNALPPWISALAAVISMLAALGAVGANVFLVYKLTALKTQFDNLQYYNQSSQAINLEVLTDKEFATFYKNTYYADRDIDWVRRLYHCFWNIGFVRWAMHARDAGVLNVPRLRERMDKRLLRMIERNPEQVAYILARGDSYDVEWLAPEVARLRQQMPGTRGFTELLVLALNALAKRKSGNGSSADDQRSDS